MQAAPESRGELGTSIRDDHFGNSTETNYPGDLEIGQTPSIVNVLMGIKWTTLVRRSIMTQIELWPRSDLGRPVIKSVPTSSHFHMGTFKGCIRPAGLWCSALTHWKTSHRAI
jgi:hypothetical protein